MELGVAGTTSNLPSPPHVDPATAPSCQTLTGLGVGITVVAALYFGKDILLPITVAVLLSFVLSPLVGALRRLQIPRVVAVVFSVGLALAIIGGVGALVGRQIVEVAGDLPLYQTTIEKKVGVLRTATLGRIAEVANRFRGTLGEAGQISPPPTSPAGGLATPPEQTPVPVEVRQPPPDPVALATRILTPVLHPLAAAAIIFIVAIFILIQQDDLRDRVIRVFGSKDLHRTTLAMDDAAGRLSRFFLVQLGINTTFGVIIATGLYFIGLPSPLLWGAIAALMRFVPYIGSYVAAAIPILLAAAVDPGWSLMLWVAALFILTEPIIGQVAEPMLYGRSTGLSSISVVISAIFWGWLWGPVGLILSTPLTLCLVVLGRHVEQLEFLNVLFGDRPALTRFQNFYQRVLAGDPDEVQEHAEELLKEMSLSSYYDEVALKGLELAARDLARGVLTRPQVDRIKDAVTTLVTELADYDDVDPGAAPLAEGSGDKSDAQDLSKHPAPAGAVSESSELPPKWRDEKPIQCIAGRGPLDDATATILAQLLEKHGLGAEVVPHEAVSRNAIGGFKRDGVPMVCVCYLDMSRHTSPLRFLLKRLRQRVGDARLLVALWPADHPVMSDQKVKAALSADEYVTSLRDAVNACLKAAHDAAAAYGYGSTTTGGNDWLKADGRPPKILIPDGDAIADTRIR
jgi:predicted PurR-regulated permease PerM